MPLVDSTNSLKRSRSARSNASPEPAHKKRCLNDRQARCREESPQPPVCELETLLRRLAKSVDFATVKALKALVTERKQGAAVTVMIQSLIERVKAIVAGRFQDSEDSEKLLQTELYVEWLREYDFVLTAVQNVLRAKIKIATGKTLFTILFHLIDEEPAGPVEPCSWVMTLVEEANDSSTDERSLAAVRKAEANLDRFDAVMALAVQRYKSESRDYWQLSKAIGSKQETLARSCCLLSEQTGFGDADDLGFGLLVTTREAMLKWKEQASDDCDQEDSGYSSK
ncbi:hypothetical protein MSAN_01838400 [Mycena sanguinolenta]|uniref:Uncharacterized protein n=1 Tax=Mycena sanguinolenta TaxID=230812 RepID=A0A8H6XTF5_9AGAR|nr:hypothetical protein MSAN_01838400 [Mycena sanguinolenta]